MTDKDRPNIDRDKIVLGPNGALWLILSGDRIPIGDETYYFDGSPAGTEIRGANDEQWAVEETPSEIDALIREAAKMATKQRVFDILDAFDANGYRFATEIANIWKYHA